VVVIGGGKVSGRGWAFLPRQNRVKGITQANVIAAWRAAGGTARECAFTLAHVYTAEEAFVTGTPGRRDASGADRRARRRQLHARAADATRGRSARAVGGALSGRAGARILQLV